MKVKRSKDAVKYTCQRRDLFGSLKIVRDTNACLQTLVLDSRYNFHKVIFFNLIDGRENINKRRSFVAALMRLTRHLHILLAELRETAAFSQGSNFHNKR